MPAPSPYCAAKRPRPLDNKFTYIGRASIDDRKAEMEFTIEGTVVTGKIKIYGVKKPNVRLAGADLTFKAGIGGSWEDPKMQIQGTWSGVDHLEPDEPNSGNISIRLLKPGELYREGSPGHTHRPTRQIRLVLPRHCPGIQSQHRPI